MGGKPKRLTINPYRSSLIKICKTIRNLINAHLNILFDSPESYVGEMGFATHNIQNNFAIKIINQNRVLKNKNLIFWIEKYSF